MIVAAHTLTRCFGLDQNLDRRVDQKQACHDSNTLLSPHPKHASVRWSTWCIITTAHAQGQVPLPALRRAFSSLRLDVYLKGS